MTQKLDFLFTTWEGGGNMTPALVVVRRLVARGHRVRLLGDNCNRPEAEATGATFVPWKTAPNRPTRTPESQSYNDWDVATPQEGLLRVIRDVWCGPSLAYAQDVMDELRREPAHLVVTSEMLYGVMAACERLDQPFATFSPNISLAPLPGVPPIGPGLPPARNEQERQMHREIAQASQGLFDSGLPAMNEARAAIGLPPLEHLLDQLKAAELELLATSRAFDFPADHLPAKVRYVGPQMGDPHWANPWRSPWSASDTRPLVVVGFSTTFQGHTGVLQKVIDALAPLEARVLVTLGGSVKTSDLRAAANCVLVDSAPHSQVMREAALAVTHGGHGTVMRSLMSRVPMLVIPHGRDQNDNAVRVTERGAGLSLMANTDVDEIRAACSRLLGEPTFKAAAKRLGDAVAVEAEQSSVVEELETAATRAQVAAA
jgi:MGT family glycosyltransferase